MYEEQLVLFDADESGERLLYPAAECDEICQAAVWAGRPAPPPAPPCVGRCQLLRRKLASPDPVLDRLVQGWRQGKLSCTGVCHLVRSLGKV